MASFSVQLLMASSVSAKAARGMAAAMFASLLLAACGGGDGGTSTPPPAATAPGAPTGVAATAGNAQASVSFAAPASNGGAAISGYTVVSSPAGGVDSQAASTSLSHTITGLNNGTTYTFTVSASNAVGTGVASAASNSVTPVAAVIITVPGAPGIGVASAGNAQISVAFSTPVSNGGAAITGYSATCGTVSANGAASPIVVAALVNGTAYTCTVTATNAIGTGAASAASNTATPNAPSTTPAGGLNDTGQSLCNNGSNVLVACATTNTGDASAMPRQDGRFGRDAKAAAGTLTKIGAGAAGFDFTKVCMSGQAAGTGACAASPPTPANQAAATANQWACTKDNNTGLTWSMQTAIDTWANATTTLPAAANGASRCGFNAGWRLPTRRELLSIVHNGVATPSIDTGFFTGAAGTLSSFYWSNDTDAALTSAAWTVGFAAGAPAPADKVGGVGIAARLVHGTVMPAGNFSANGDGTVTDSVTGLMWDQCSQGQSGAACATGSATSMGWTAALMAAVTANAANYKGHNDWRLPNKNELESLVDISIGTNPAINLTAFPATPVSGVYWSSTMYGGATPGVAWYFFFDHPLGNVNTLSATLQVRLVRAGQSVDAFDRF